MSCICVDFEKHPLEGSCQEAILPLDATFDNFFPLRSLWHTPLLTCGCRRVPVFLRVMSAVSAPHQAPIRIKASDISPPSQMSAPGTVSVPQKTVSSLPCPNLYNSQISWLPCGSRFSMAHGRGVARFHHSVAGARIGVEVRTNQIAGCEPLFEPVSNPHPLRTTLQPNALWTSKGTRSRIM